MPISIHLRTMYADLIRQCYQPLEQVIPASISVREITGASYLYAIERHGSKRVQKYIGPASDPDAVAEANRIREAAAARKTRLQEISVLRNAVRGLPTISTKMAKVLDSLSRNGMFVKNNLCLIGTAAFRQYPFLVGEVPGNDSSLTQDIDLAVMPLFVAKDFKIDLSEIISRGGPGLAPERSVVPPSRFFDSTGFGVEFLTNLRRNNETFVTFQSLGISAQALPYLDYLTSITVDAVVLWQDGILIRVPAPSRYAVHKLIVANLRPEGDLKRQKDLAQAKFLLTTLDKDDPGPVELALLEATKSKKWERMIAKSLKEIELDYLLP